MTSVKQLFVVRHGHAAFDAAIDFERPLTPRGIAEAHQTAEYILKKSRQLSNTPLACLSSAAVRTRQTADIICRVNGIEDIEYDETLYATSVSHWLDKISQISTQNLLLVGHNPTFSQMVRHWCGYEYHMQPANCAVIALEICQDGITYPACLHDFYQNEQLPGA